MARILTHTATWQNERRSTLLVGYCFSSINADVQGKPKIPGLCDTNLG
jgi:hypothetical protein